MSVEAIVSTAVGAILGGGVVLLGDHLRLKAENTRAVAEWDRRRLEQRLDFERSTVLELQDAVHAILRATAVVMNEQSRLTEEHGLPYSAGVVGDEVAEAARIAHSDVWRLIGRTSDEALRGYARSVVATCSSIQAAASHGDAMVTFGRGTEAAERFNSRLNDVLGGL